MLDRKHVLGVVMAHGAAEATVRRHMPYWLKVCDRVEVWVPSDQYFQPLGPRMNVRAAVPNGGAYSPATSLRFAIAMDSALKMGYRYTLLMEYDSLCWGPIPYEACPPMGAMGACKFANEKRSPVPGLTFLAPFYLHFPHLYSWEALGLVCSAMDDMTKHEEYGYSDRFLGMAVHKAHVPVLDYIAMGLGISWENISRHDHRICQTIEAVKRGAVFSHGIKDEPSLQRIMAVAPFGLA